MANLLDEFGLRGAGLGASTNGNLLDEFGIERPEQKDQGDGAFTRGWNKAANAMAVSANMAIGDNQAAAERLKVASDYNAANPGSQESQELMHAWETGEGVSGAFSSVGGEIAKDWREASGLGGKLKSAWDNTAAVGETLAEQTGNMVAPLAGMGVGHAAGRAVGTPIGAGIGAVVGAPVGGVGAVPGAGAGGAIGGAVGSIGGSILGGAIGNAAQESGYMALGDIQEAGIDPGDVDAVRAYLDENSGRLLKQGAIKGAIIATVDRLTMGVASKLLNGPLRDATNRALANMGVDAADKAAVKAATQSDAFAAHLAGDAAYQSSKQGAERIARNMAAFAVDPAGEFTGEYVGKGVATGEWDAKDATLEAVMGLGQSGVMYAGQKAYQAATGIGSGAEPMVQPQPTAENPAPAPVPAPDPAAGPISRTAAQLPGPSIAGLLPDPGQTLYGDAAGNLSPGGQPRNVDREYRPTGRERGPQTFGPGMDQSVPMGEPAPLEGQLIRGGIGAQPQPSTREPAIYDNEPSLGLPAPSRAIPDMRGDNITVAPDGTAVPGKTPNTPPKRYIQGGPGMDQQREVGKTYKGLPAANRAIRESANPEQLEAVKVGPQTFEVRPKAAETEAPGAEGAAFDRADGSTETLDSGMTIVHGSGSDSLKADDIQIVRVSGQKQGKKGRVYGGFYGTSEADAAQAEGYAGMMGGTPTLYDVKIKPGTKVLNKSGDITRLSEEYINELVSQGYGLVTGTDPRGRTEYVVIDKNAIKEMVVRGKPAGAMAEQGKQGITPTDANVEAGTYSDRQSDRPADVGAARGQNDMFGPKTRGERKAEQAQPEWAQFPEGSGTLGIPRAEMPQIKAEHRGAMVNFLNARDIEHTELSLPATELKPTQAEFSPKKVEAAKSFAGGDRSILTSSDGHVLDGHHQWLAKREAGEEVKVIRLDAPIRQLLETVAEFPSATTDQSSAAPPGEAESISPETKAAELDAQAFISAPDGSLDFGEITPEMAKAAGRQAGKIRLQQGDESWGLQHIEQRHGAEIRDAGFADVPAFVADIAQHIDQVWKPAATRQLVALHAAGKNRVMFVELQPGRDESGDFYTVKTAFPARPGYTKKENWKLLWEARAQASGESGNRPSFAVSPPVAGGEVTIPSSQSSEASIAPPAGGKPAADQAGDRPAESKIEDAGEKLGGARKDQLRTVRERLDDMDDEAIAGSSLSQLWPKGELDKITDPFEAALYHVVRGLIPAKPRVSYRVKAWVGKVKAARDILTTLGRLGADASAEKMRAFSPDLGIVADQIEVLMALDRKHWGRIDNIRRAHGRYNQDGEMVPGSWVSLNIDGRTVAFYGHETVASAIPAIKERVEGESAPEKRMKFAIYTDRQTGDVFVVKEGDAEMRRLKTFKTVKEARAFLNDEYEAAVALWDAVKNRDNVTKSDMRRATNEPRVGQDHRNGKDVTPEQFIEAFGFRGVEFGNWVKQGAGGRERQGMLNDAYDAFMDLAGILNIPPKALSLEGKLGIGFGSRGSGKASAHYEPDLVVINMTKTKGAGTLAHEWFHALDNYFARRRAEQPGSGIAMTDRETAYITYRPERLWVNKKHPSMRMTRSELSRYQTNHPGAPLYQEGNWEPDAKHPNGVRPQVEKAFAELVATLNASPMLQRAKVIDGKTSDGYWSRIIERGARSFETYVIARLADQGFRNDYLANVQTLEQFSRDPGRYPYLTPDEQGPVNEAFDKLFATLETKETDLGVALFSRAGGPIDPDGLSESSMVAGKVPENPISLEEAIAAAKQFLADYNGNIELSYRIRKKQDELYGPGSIAKIGVIKGAYHPGRGLFTLASDHLSSAADAHETLRHEILGHYGLDTFSPQDKQALLDKILASKEEPSLKPIWDDIAVVYADKSENIQAEEVFARLAEGERSGKEKLADLIGSLLTRLLRKVLGYKKGVITRRELLREIEVISKGIRNGSRPRQTFESETKQRRGEQTETPAFKRWFGDSKVVDANGEPMVVYHGTTADFTAFDRNETRTGVLGEGFYFSPEPERTRSYAGGSRFGGQGYAEGGSVMPVYVSLQNPLVLRAGQRADLSAESKGHDGVIQLDAGGGIETVVAFSPEQIKSATGNNGEFDPSNPDIRYSLMSDAADLFTRFGQRPADPNDPFAEENRRLREQDKSLWDKAKREFRRQFAPGGLLPDAVFGEKVKRDSEFQAVEFDVRHLARGLERAIKADFGAAIDDLPGDQMKRLADALAGKVDPTLPESTKVAVVAMRQYIDSLSAEYIGILQQQVRDNLKGADAALIEKITGNIGSYVHRSYQAFDDPKWFQKVPTEVVNAARHYLAKGYMEQGDSKKEAYERAEVKVNEMLKTGTAYDSMESFIAEGKLGAKDLSVLIKRKSIAPEIRALLGEYSDPRLNFAKSATKMGRLIWNQRFLDRVREDGLGVFLFEGKDRPAGATVQIAGEASDTYAPLNGLWTFPDVAQAFKDSLGKEQMSDLYRTIVRLNGMVKYGKTVLSPTTAMRNWQSAMFFSLANGHFDLIQMKRSWAALREQVTQNATGDDLTYLRKLKQLGVVYDTPYAGEMMALLNDARMDELLSGKSGAGFKWLRKINEVAQGFYSFGDDFWKIIGFENEKASLLKAGIPAAQAEQMAAERIRNTYPTYSMVGKGINWLRRFPLAGTFVSFPAEIIRTSVNMLQLTAADLKSDNPGLQAIGRKRVVGMAMVSAGFYALAAMTAAAFGVGDDEEEAIRDLAAPWQRNSTFLYTGRDADGKLRYFDMSFLDPYGYWKRPLTAMLRDQPWEKAAASGIGDMLSPFLGTDIAAGAIFEVLANKKASGGQVYQESAGAVDQTTAIADHLRKALQPGFVSNAERLLLAGQGARREGSGQPYDMRDEVVSLLGWRASTLDTQTALYYRSFEFTDGLRDASKVLNRTLRSSNKVSDGDIRSARETAQTQYDQAFKEMGRLVNSARAAGMSNQQIAQTLKLSGVSQVNVMALLAGRVPPMNAATLQGQVKATQQARLMQGSEHAQEIARRFAVARQL